MARRSAPALRCVSETAADRPHSEIAARIEPMPRLCMSEPLSPSRCSASATFMTPPSLAALLRCNGLPLKARPKHLRLESPRFLRGRLRTERQAAVSKEDGTSQAQRLPRWTLVAASRSAKRQGHRAAPQAFTPPTGGKGGPALAAEAAAAP